MRFFGVFSARVHSASNVHAVLVACTARSCAFADAKSATAGNSFCAGSAAISIHFGKSSFYSVNVSACVLHGSRAPSAELSNGEHVMSLARSVRRMRFVGDGAARCVAAVLFWRSIRRVASGTRQCQTQCQLQILISIVFHVVYVKIFTCQTNVSFIYTHERARADPSASRRYPPRRCIHFGRI